MKVWLVQKYENDVIEERFLEWSTTEAVFSSKKKAEAWVKNKGDSFKIQEFEMNPSPPIPNPGSKEAVQMGCKCAIMDNHYGRGYHGKAGQFAITGGCPVHDPTDQAKGQ